SRQDDDQYVELYNKGNSAVNVGAWKFIAGISFTFPSNTIINPDTYLVVARNASRLRTNYSNLGPANLLGDFGGKLSHRGERIALAMPDLVIATNNHGVLTTNTAYPVVVEVLNASGVNQIANSSFESGVTGWTAEGTEDKSGLETSGGYTGTKSYHVRAIERGDNQVNRIRVPLISALPTTGATTATIRA